MSDLGKWVLILAVLVGAAAALYFNTRSPAPEEIAALVKAQQTTASEACAARGLKYFRETGNYPQLKNGRDAETVAQERCSRAGGAFHPVQQPSNCVLRGIAYFKEIGSYPKLSTGRDAAIVAEERCSRSPAAFP